jgi:predicted permease
MTGGMKMSKKEKRWRRFYLFLMIFFYAIYVPVSVLEWLLGDGGLPITAVVVGIALPYMRKNHLHQIQMKEGTGA